MLRLLFLRDGAMSADPATTESYVNRRSQHTFGRKALWPIVAIAVMVLVILAGAGEAIRYVQNDEPTLIGTALDGQAASDFRLIDHRGQPVQLSDFRGRAVALTFIFTNCTDVCPLTAINMGAAYELLPEDTRDDVAFLAVTVDPGRDTQEALQEFSATYGLADNPNWFALRGDASALAPVWQSYGINPGTEMATPVRHDGDHDASSSGGLGHTDAIYLIDPEGRERVFMRSSASPEDVAENLVTLLQ